MIPTPSILLAAAAAAGAASETATATHDFTADLAIVVVAAAVAAMLCRPLRLPALVGYLLAGVAIGPHTPFPIFANAEQVHAMSEFGVILVMFCVGLEFTLGRFVRGLPRAGGIALLEISLMAWLGYTVGVRFGLGTVEALFLGGSIAISSTMVVSRLFDRAPPDADVREVVLSALVIQDLAAIILLTIFAGIGAGIGLSPDELRVTITKLGLFLGVVVVGGLLVVPRLVSLAERTGTPETRVVLAVALCFGLGYFADSVGYSGALGAFVAGILVAEAGRGHEYTARVQPLQDVFAAVFFVSVGMSFDPAAVWENLGLTLVLLGVVISGQLLSVTVGGLMTGLGVRRSIVAGMALGQIGEFAFIIAGVGAAAGVTPPFLLPCLVAVAIATSLSSLLAYTVGADFALWVERRLPARLRTVLSLYEAWFEQLREGGVTDRKSVRRFLIALAVDVGALVVIAAADDILRDRITQLAMLELGLSLSWAGLAHQALVIAMALPFVIGIARASARLARSLGEQILPRVGEGELDLANAPRRALSVVLQVSVVTAVGALLLAVTQPFTGGLWNVVLVAAVLISLLPVLWRDSGNLDGHLRAGAEVVAAALHRSATAGLGQGLASARALPGAKGVASASSAPAPTGPKPADDNAADVALAAALLPGVGTIEVIRLHPDSPFCGLSLEEVALQRASGALVLAVSRDDGDVIRPTPEVRLQAGDAIALAGSSRAVARARAHLDPASVSPDVVTDSTAESEAPVGSPPAAPASTPPSA